MKYLILFSFCSLMFLSSCSSDSDDVDPIIGIWEGKASQENLGDIVLEVNISSIVENSISGRLSSYLEDLSSCDTDVFDCVLFSCSANWTYDGMTGDIYNFTELADPGSPCSETGEVSLRFTGDNTLSGTFAFDVDPSDLVKLAINPIVLNRVN